MLISAWRRSPSSSCDMLKAMTRGAGKAQWFLLLSKQKKAWSNQFCPLTLQFVCFQQLRVLVRLCSSPVWIDFVVDATSTAHIIVAPPQRSTTPTPCSQKRPNLLIEKIVWRCEHTFMNTYIVNATNLARKNGKMRTPPQAGEAPKKNTDANPNKGKEVWVGHCRLAVRG